MGTKRLAVREGTFRGGLPYLAAGAGEPLIYLCGSAPNHRNPAPGVERFATMKTVQPLAKAGFEVFFTNRWPNMDPETTWADIAERHADAILDRFNGPVHVLGHSTGGSLLLQLIADRPECVRRAVVASAAYRLGPVARRAQLSLMRGLDETGRFTAQAMAEGAEGMIRRRWLRALLYPLFIVAAPRIKVERVSDAVTMLRAEDGFNVHDRLAEIQTETLLICGARDYFWTPDMFAETALRMPHGHLVMYPDAGHAIVTDHRFAGDVNTFLRADLHRKDSEAIH